MDKNLASSMRMYASCDMHQCGRRTFPTNINPRHYDKKWSGVARDRTSDHGVFAEHCRTYDHIRSRALINFTTVEFMTFSRGMSIFHFFSVNSFPEFLFFNKTSNTIVTINQIFAVPSK